MTQYRFDEGTGRFVDQYNVGTHDEEPLNEDVVGWHGFWKDYEGETWAEIILHDQLNLCGCQDTDLLKPLFVAYLRGEWGRYKDSIIQFDTNDPLQTLVATLCTNINFTEHGGSIGGSWLRPEGERWLSLVDRETAS